MSAPRRVSVGASWAGAAVGLVLALACARGLSAQVVQGRVLDADNGRPISLAGVYLLDRDHNSLLVAMADSLGQYALTVPEAGDYFLAAQRFGYRDVESPLLAISVSRDYALDLELSPAPLGLGELTVTVSNERVMDWLTREFGANPAQAFGFRLLQGERLSEAKKKGGFRPTETLRWLYIPVSHGTACVSINATPRAATVGFRGPRHSGFGAPGSAPRGTESVDDLRREVEKGPDLCGRLVVDDQVIPNAQLENVDMGSVAMIVTLPGEVRIYTYGFDYSFR